MTDCGVAKKQKLLEIPQATMEMLARCVATLKPPPELTLSQWADRYRMLSAESSAEPGRWHTDKAPYQREIMDAIGDAHIRRVVIMCAAQLGKTELLLNILGYFMAYAPAPILVMQPTLDMGQTFSKDRLAPMIRDTPVLRGLVDVKSRYAGNTILKKNFPGGHITIVGANSATGLASRPIKVLLADEVDRYPGSAGTEGDPLSLAQKRQTTFWDKKTVMVSTPVIKGHSRIETEYNQSTREEWNVPCPECGHYQPFVWANLIFDPDDLQKEIVYKCERCGCVANEYRWKQQSQQGRFVAENPGAETRGFHLNTLASTFCGWKEIVQKFIVAKEQLDQGNPEGMKVWVNTELGETWEERGEQVAQYVDIVLNIFLGAAAVKLPPAQGFLGQVCPVVAVPAVNDFQRGAGGCPLGGVYRGHGGHGSVKYIHGVALPHTSRATKWYRRLRPPLFSSASASDNFCAQYSISSRICFRSALVNILVPIW